MQSDLSISTLVISWCHRLSFCLNTSFLVALGLKHVVHMDRTGHFLLSVKITMRRAGLPIPLHRFFAGKCFWYENIQVKVLASNYVGLPFRAFLALWPDRLLSTEFDKLQNIWDLKTFLDLNIIYLPLRLHYTWILSKCLNISFSNLKSSYDSNCISFW